MLGYDMQSSIDRNRVGAYLFVVALWQGLYNTPVFLSTEYLKASRFPERINDSVGNIVHRTNYKL